MSGAWQTRHRFGAPPEGGARLLEMSRRTGWPRRAEARSVESGFPLASSLAAHAKGPPVQLAAMSGLDQNKLDEIETATAGQGTRHTLYRPFGHHWRHPYFGKWQTISYALLKLLPEGATVLDIGCGSVWTRPLPVTVRGQRTEEGRRDRRA